MKQQYLKMDVVFKSKSEEKPKFHRFCNRQGKWVVGQKLVRTFTVTRDVYPFMFSYFLSLLTLFLIRDFKQLF